MGIAHAFDCPNPGRLVNVYPGCTCRNLGRAATGGDVAVRSSGCPVHEIPTEKLLELIDVEVLVEAIQSVPDVSDTDALRDALIGCLDDAVNLGVLLEPEAD